MNLYLISQTVNREYDTFDAAVVAAESEEIARGINPSASMFTEPDDLDSWCAPEHVSVKLIGAAAPGISSGVVLGSFNAG